jgi:glycine/D-amino acid oxidase-like deaminating enzyme
LDGRIRTPPEWTALMDVAGGFLHPERAIAALLSDAQAHGALVHRNCHGRAIDNSGKQIVIKCGVAEIAAERVIITTGAWATELLPELAAVTRVERRVLHWYEAPNAVYTTQAGFAPFAVATGDGRLFYGFPANPVNEVKIAEHDTVEVIAGPDVLDRNVSDRDLAFIAPLISQFMPHLGRRTRSAVCMYPMSSDEHFILDRSPRDARIVIGAGLSGHGFKFAPVIGEALANMALERAQAIDVGYFALARRAGAL